jgi:hypothetical protein
MFLHLFSKLSLKITAETFYQIVDPVKEKETKTGVCKALYHYNKKAIGCIDGEILLAPAPKKYYVARKKAKLCGQEVGLFNESREPSRRWSCDAIIWDQVGIDFVIFFRIDAFFSYFRKPSVCGCRFR